MSEMQTQQSVILLPPNSNGHGGARSGAGRKPGSTAANKRPKPTADEQLRVLTATEERQQWRELVEAAKDNPKLRLEVLKAVSELRRGRPGVNQRTAKPVANDPRLMIAIQNLIPGSKHLQLDAPTDDTRTPKRRGRRKSLPISE